MYRYVQNLIGSKNTTKNTNLKINIYYKNRKYAMFFFNIH